MAKTRQNRRWKTPKRPKSEPPHFDGPVQDPQTDWPSRPYLTVWIRPDRTIAAFRVSSKLDLDGERAGEGDDA